MARQVRIVGGVMDGASHAVPKGADEGFTIVIAHDAKPPFGEEAQTTEYVLRADGDSEALVAAGLKWPFLEAASA